MNLQSSIHSWLASGPTWTLLCIPASNLIQSRPLWMAEMKLRDSLNWWRWVNILRHYLKVSFTSKVTWQLETNILRCNPKFNNKPRYDHILVANPTGGVMFARLIFMFTTSNQNRTDPWVLIQPYDTEVGRPSPLEWDFQLFRIHAKARGSSRFISPKSIIRGVVVVPTYEKDSDYFVFDLLDDDLFMRVRDLWKERLRTINN